MLNWCQKVDIQHTENHYHYYHAAGTPVPSQKPRELSRLKVDSIVVSSLLKKNVEKSTSKSLTKQICANPKPVSSPERRRTEEELFRQRQPVLWHLFNSSLAQTSKEMPEQQQTLKTQPRTRDGQKRRGGIQTIMRKQKPEVFCEKVSNIEHKSNPVSSTLEDTKLSNPFNITFSQKTSKELEMPTTHLQYKNSSLTNNSNHLRSTYSHHPERSKSSNKSSLISIYSRVEPPHESVESSQMKKMQRLSLWHDPDRHTIMSKDIDGTSEHSFRIEESFIFQHDTAHNFHMIRQIPLRRGQLTLQLGIQKRLGGLVSILERDIKEMDLIAREIQIYEMISQRKDMADCFPNVLSLYQIQIFKNSYLLIKEPFTRTLGQYLQEVGSGSRKRTALEGLLKQLGDLLSILGQFEIYPARLMEVEDFVECLSVFKIHNLSLFRQSPQQAYPAAQIIAHLSQSLQMC